jgi:hypothetical protein
MPGRGDEGRAEMRGLFAMQTLDLSVRCPECGRFALRVCGELKGSVEAICADHRCRAMFKVEVGADGTQTVAILRKARRA